MILLKQARSLKAIKMNKVFIIAEAGVNHNGSVNLAMELVDIAVDAGADAIKFQTFKANKLLTNHAHKAEYQLANTSKNETQFEMLRKLELDENSHLKLLEYCKKKKIMFLSTPFDSESIDFLNSIEMKIFKIPSGEITNLPYLKHIGSLDKKLILSTGMSNLAEVRDALTILEQAGTPKEKITLLHATTEYPCPFEDVNLLAMLTMKKEFGISVGYSDHTSGVEVAIAAAALGASVIEKHFTIDRKMEGPDHKASLEPRELKYMIACIRNISSSLGDGVKKPSNSELKNMSVARKSIVAASSIKIGEVFNEKNLTVKRPALGLSPMKWNELIGKLAQKDYKADDLI